MGGEEIAMPPLSLPDRPSLQNLKSRVKQFLQSVRAGEAEAVARVREFHPRAGEALVRFKLSDAQLVAARAYGFASWTRLKSHIESIARYAWDPPVDATPGAD